MPMLKAPRTVSRRKELRQDAVVTGYARLLQLYEENRNLVIGAGIALLGLVLAAIAWNFYGQSQEQRAALLKNIITLDKWRIKLEQKYKAQYDYNILLGKFLDYESAKKLHYELIEKGLGTRIKTLGDTLYYRDKIINDNSQYWVIVDNFSSAEQAQLFAQNVAAEV